MSAQEREGHARLMAAAGVIEDRRTLSTVVLGGDNAEASLELGLKRLRSEGFNVVDVRTFRTGRPTLTNQQTAVMDTLLLADAALCGGTDKSTFSDMSSVHSGCR